MHLTEALAAYRTEVPLETFLSGRWNEFGNRLDDLASAYQEAHGNMENAVRIIVHA